MSGILKYKQLIEIQTIKNYFTQKTMLIERKTFVKKYFSLGWFCIYLAVTITKEYVSNWEKCEYSERLLCSQPVALSGTQSA